MKPCEPVITPEQALEIVERAKKIREELDAVEKVYGGKNLSCPFRKLGLSPIGDAEKIRIIVKGIVGLGLERCVIELDERTGCDEEDRRLCWYFEPKTYGTGGEDSYCAFHIASDLLRFGDRSTRYYGLCKNTLIIPDKSVTLYQSVARKLAK